MKAVELSVKPISITVPDVGSTLFLMGTGLISLGLIRRRKN